MGEELKDSKVYFQIKMKWYKKLWYLITFRKYKISEYQELKGIGELKIRMIDNQE